tara:strand:+ start:473 stop:694 length:222 start_codon:yes stop_codon:yes gene_type:complete
MPDITMCKGDGCPLREGCYRCTAKPDQFQYYMIEPYDKEAKTCGYYYPLSGENEDIKDERKNKLLAKPIPSDD